MHSQLENNASSAELGWVFDDQQNQIGFRTRRKLIKLEAGTIALRPWEEESLRQVFHNMAGYCLKNQIPFPLESSELFYRIVQNLFLTNTLVNNHRNRWGYVGNINLFTGLEQEFAQDPPNAQFDKRIEGLLHSLFEDSELNLYCVQTDGYSSDKPKRLVYEVSGQPKWFMDTLLDRLMIESFLNKNAQLLPFSEHVNVCLVDEIGPLFPRLGPEFVKHVANGIIQAMADALPLLATPGQLDGIESTTMKFLSWSDSDDSEVAKIHAVRIIKDETGTISHLEIRRVMSGNSAPFDPYLATLAVVSTGILNALCSDISTRPMPPVEYIGTSPYIERLARLPENYFSKELTPIMKVRLLAITNNNKPQGNRVLNNSVEPM